MSAKTVCSSLEYNKSINTLIIPPYFTLVCLSLLIIIWGSSYPSNIPHCGSPYKMGFVSFVPVNQIYKSLSLIPNVCKQHWPFQCLTIRNHHAWCTFSELFGLKVHQKFNKNWCILMQMFQQESTSYNANIQSIGLSYCHGETVEGWTISSWIQIDFCVNH